MHVDLCNKNAHFFFSNVYLYVKQCFSLYAPICVYIVFGRIVNVHVIARESGCGASALLCLQKPLPTNSVSPDRTTEGQIREAGGPYALPPPSVLHWMFGSSVTAQIRSQLGHLPCDTQSVNVPGSDIN